MPRLCHHLQDHTTKVSATLHSAILQYITSHHGKTKQFPMHMDKIFHQGHEPVNHSSCSKIPISCQNHQNLNAANHHFKHHVKSHNIGRSYKKQPRGVTNRLEHRQPCHTAQSSKKKSNSNARKSCQTPTTSCRDRSPTTFPCKHNRINEDANNLSHLDTQSFNISMVALDQYSQDSIDSIDFTPFQDHVLPET